MKSLKRQKHHTWKKNRPVPIGLRQVTSAWYQTTTSVVFHNPGISRPCKAVWILRIPAVSILAFGVLVTPNTYPDATTEIDIYAGYNGTIPTVEKLGYTVGIYGYLYPGGSWKKYRGSTTVDSNGNPDPNRPLTPGGGRWDTYEANVGVSYDWISAKLSYTLTDWFGADKSTGWNGSTKGSTYVELNAAYPLPWWDLTLIAHVGHLDVAGKLDTEFSSDGRVNFPSSSLSGATNPDYTDWKIGLSKAFKIGATEGWNAGVYWIESDNSRYWGYRGYGGSSFNGKGTNGAVESKNLNDGRLVLTLGRTF